MSPRDIAAANAAFWETLCGTALAQSLQITGRAPGDLQRYDDAYFAFYPYLRRYADRLRPRGTRLLEIGLGYGTLGQYLAELGADYRGVDIASAPVELMRHRLSTFYDDADDRVLQGSALQIPFADESFDRVVSIGCLHHTGDLPRAISEVHRVLARGGVALVMLYNRHSFRRLVEAPVKRVRAKVRKRGGSFDEELRRWYDSNEAGEAAPHTDFVSRGEVRDLFRDFRHLDIQAENFDHLVWRGKVLVERDRLLGVPARILGLDLYIVASC